MCGTARNRKYVRRVFSFVACLSILALALPCNCMAEQQDDPVQSEHPCHSSNKTTDQGEHNDGNCCCSDSLNLLTPNISAEASDIIRPSGSSTTDAQYCIKASFDAGVLDSIELIGEIV